jgi:PLP dependent protein
MAEGIQSRLAQVRQRIGQAAKRVGRRAEEITLITVSKTFDSRTVQAAVDAGALILGENRVQEAVEKSQQVKAEGLQWHLIGHLQANKARHAVRTFDVIHTIDNVEIALRLERIAAEDGRRPVVLVQVDLGKEASKSGADESQLLDLVEALDGCGNLQFKGLMTLPPFFETAEQTRPYFRRLRELLISLNANRQANRQLTELSMGMSHDFEVAIEEGATMVRVGSAIFGERNR